ncbi:helix-turn-helix domain-containing protein [Metabacillus indicus]|uniref:helix-turn-helix domain-containing protein n=1 Tax=Metabacillus indicus TaxID=246786 RepID=UPI0011114E31|nr:helix-turn-helix transcriptional regulator [Metabacillus indicus]
MIIIKIGKRIRELRETRGIPLGCMAESLNLSVSHLLSIERNTRRATSNEIADICRVLGVKRYELYADTIDYL